MLRLRRMRGTSMVEFSLVAPLALLLMFGVIDFGRAIQINSTVADAARQGARQAAANDAETPANAFGSPTGSCSGTVFTYSSSIGTGCLSDAAILATVRAVLKDAIAPSQVTLATSVDAASCGKGTGANAAPQAGAAVVCISQPASGAVSGTAPATCASVWAQSSYPFGGALGGRQDEFTNGTYRGCYVITVTVVAAFSPWTPLVRQVAGSSIVLRASTSTIAEY